MGGVQLLVRVAFRVCERCELHLHGIDVDLIMIRLQLRLKEDLPSLLSAAEALLTVVDDLGYLRRRSEAMLLGLEVRVAAGEIPPRSAIDDVALAIRESGNQKTVASVARVAGRSDAVELSVQGSVRTWFL